MVGIRGTAISDLEFLREHDQHLRPDVLVDLIAGERVLVAEGDDGLVGWLRWGLFWDEIPFMNMLVVLEHHRGHGLGRRLVTAWEQAMAAGGYPMVMTSSLSDEDAQHLYRRLGYVDTGALLLPDEATEIVFRKQLCELP